MERPLFAPSPQPGPTASRYRTPDVDDSVINHRYSRSRRVYAFGGTRAKNRTTLNPTVIIQRYVAREILHNFLGVLALLLIILTCFSFVRYLTQAAAGTLSSGPIFELLALTVIGKLPILVPLALYAAVLLGLGRLYKDSEMVAMVAGGVGVGRIAVAVFWLALVVCALAMVVSLYVAPKVAAVKADVYAQAKEDSEFTGIYPGRFKVFRDGEVTLYVESMAADGRVMHEVFAQILKDDKEIILVAKSAHKRVEGIFGRQYIVAKDGYRYVGQPGQVNYEITRFREHAILIDTGGAEPAFKKQDAYSTSELLNSTRAAHQAAFQARVSKPLSIVLLALLAIPLARTSPRQGKYAKLFTAFLIYFAYNNGVEVFQKFIERGDISPLVGVWPVHLVVALLVAVLLTSQSLAPGSMGRWAQRLRVRT